MGALKSGAALQCITLCSLVIRLINKILILITKISAVSMKLHHIGDIVVIIISMVYNNNIIIVFRHSTPLLIAVCFASIMKSRETVSVRLFRLFYSRSTPGFDRKLRIEFNKHILYCLHINVDHKNIIVTRW